MNDFASQDPVFLKEGVVPVAACIKSLYQCSPLQLCFDPDVHAAELQATRNVLRGRPQSFDEGLMGSAHLGGMATTLLTLLFTTLEGASLGSGWATGAAAAVVQGAGGDPQAGIGLAASATAYVAGTGLGAASGALTGAGLSLVGLRYPALLQAVRCIWLFMEPVMPRRTRSAALPA